MNQLPQPLNNFEDKGRQRAVLMRYIRQTFCSSKLRKFYKALAGAMHMPIIFTTMHLSWSYQENGPCFHMSLYVTFSEWDAIILISHRMYRAGSNTSDMSSIQVCTSARHRFRMISSYKASKWPPLPWQIAHLWLQVTGDGQCFVPSGNDHSHVLKCHMLQRVWGILHYKGRPNGSVSS